MSDSGDEKRKIIVDEDWKTQVENEKARLKEPPRVALDAETSDTQASPSGADASLPPASFQLLVSSLATQSLIFLGQVPDPIDNSTVLRPNAARHYIDLLEMLQEKTQGNLTEVESRELEDILHQLRMLFVMVQQSGE